MISFDGSDAVDGDNDNDDGDFRDASTYISDGIDGGFGTVDVSSGGSGCDGGGDISNVGEVVIALLVVLVVVYLLSFSYSLIIVIVNSFSSAAHSIGRQSSGTFLATQPDHRESNYIL